MALFLPPNVKPLEPAANLENWDDQIDSESALANADIFKKPIGVENRNVDIDYFLKSIQWNHVLCLKLLLLTLSNRNA